MYPSEPKPPNKRLADLTTVQEMFQESKETITGYCIKSMTSDPYGHPVLAVTDGKVGSMIVYDAVDEKKILRKIGAGWHEVESVTFDPDYNFTMVTEKPTEKCVVKYNIKGDLLHSFEIEEIVKIFGVTTMDDGRMAVSLQPSTNTSVVRIYSPDGSTIQNTIHKDSKGKGYFIKPQCLVSSGENVIVGDIGTKNLRCFSVTSGQVIWTHPMDMPRGMCVDGAGNICACDFRNNKLTLLSPTGQLLGHCLTALSKPQYVAMNHNRLFVLDMGRSTSYRLSVYNLFDAVKAKKRQTTHKPEWQSVLTKGDT